MSDKAKALQKSIKLWEEIMIEAQGQIRQAETLLEKMQREYIRAMQEKSDLMDQLIEENDKIIKFLKENN
jgi:hypothetical protein